MSMGACTIFTTALCNLNCGYCYICKDKNGGLAQIDKDIEENLKSGQVLQQVLDFGNNIEQTLRVISLWGGEPFLHMDRFTEQIDQWFQHFPNIDTFTTSTNFTVEDEIEQFQRLLQAIEKYGPKERYDFNLQISLDGYPEMTDFGRGKGVTEKLLNNYSKLLNMPYNRKKINLWVVTKATVSKDSMQFLDSIDKCRKWVEFFNNELYMPLAKANFPFTLRLGLFNFAQPTEWDTEDGLLFAKISKYLSQIDPKIYPGWKDYHSFVPMANQIIDGYVDNINYSEPCCGNTCGAFVGEVIPIPHGKYTACHRGLFDNYVDYCNTTNNKEYMNGLSKSYFAPKDRSKWLLTLEQLQSMHHTLSYINSCPNQLLYTDYIIFIREYARQGIIDRKYLDIEEIEKTLPHFLNNSYCMQNSFMQTGSWTTIDTYEIPLLYNGAMDVAIDILNQYIERMQQF